MPVLESYRGRDIVGVEELAAVATSLIEQHAGEEPVRGSARLAISARTVRHYLSESLLGEPTGQTSASIVFNYGNLLRLLAVKKLLADNWSVVKVREFMRAMDITALEEFVNSALRASKLAQTDSKHAREHKSAKSLRASGSTDDEQAAPQSTLFQSQPAPLTSLTAESARRRERAVAEWVEIAPGLEIKVRRSFRPPASEEERARLAMRFWSVIIKDNAEGKMQNDE